MYQYNTVIFTQTMCAFDLHICGILYELIDVLWRVLGWNCS